MTEIAIYGLPVRMPHWSFGVRYIYQLIQHRMGLSRLFEVVFPGNPGSRLSRQEQQRGGERAGHRARARSRGLLDQQHAVPAQPGPGRRAHRRAGRRACAPDRHGDRGAWAASAWSPCSMRRCRSSSTSTSIRALRRAALSGTDAPSRAPPPNDEFSRRFAALGPDTARPQRDRAGEARADSAASGKGSAVVHRAVRAGAGAVGARHLPRRARGVVLFLSRLRLPDHERRLGLVLARAAAARSGFPAAVGLRRCDQVPLGRRAPDAPAARTSRCRPIRITSASRSGKRSSRSRGSTPRARSCARTTTSRSCATI